AAPTGFAGADAPAVAVAVAVDLDLDLRGPTGAAESADKTPQGRRTRMCGVFRAGFDASSENPAGPADPVQSTGRAGRGVLSLRQVSLHMQRKVARAVTARKLLILMSEEPKQQAGQDPPYEAAVAAAAAVDLDLDLRGPSGAAGAADQTPQGRRTWMCGVFRAGRMPARKIPPAPRTRCAAPGAQAGVCFLCARFLCTSKERWLAPSRRESS